MKARRSPVAVGLVLGLLVGAGAIAAIATSESGGAPSAARVPVPPGEKIVIAVPNTPNGGATPLGVHANLPALTGRARSYQLGDQPSPGAIARLADALDVHGDVQTDAGGWVVRQDNRLVRVQRAAGVPWFFSLLQGPCSMVPNEALPSVPPSGPSDCPEAEGPPSGPVRPAGLPGHDDALAFGMATLGKAGLGVSRPVIVDQGTSWHIETGPVIAGKLTSGFGWTVTVGPGPTVLAASGFLAAPEPARSYPLAGTKEGLQRARAVAGGDVVGVHLGLMVGRVGDASYLVPAYLFELQGPGDAPPPVVTVPAVEDRYLA